MFTDLRFAIRQLLKSRSFRFIAILTRALGIGANSAIFTIVHAVFLERLPYRNADRVVAIWETNAARARANRTVSAPRIFFAGKSARPVSNLAAYAESRANLTGNYLPARRAARVDPLVALRAE